MKILNTRSTVTFIESLTLSLRLKDMKMRNKYEVRWLKIYSFMRIQQGVQTMSLSMILRLLLNKAMKCLNAKLNPSFLDLDPNRQIKTQLKPIINNSTNKISVNRVAQL